MKFLRFMAGVMLVSVAAAQLPVRAAGESLFPIHGEVVPEDVISTELIENVLEKVTELSGKADGVGASEALTQQSTSEELANVSTEQNESLAAQVKELYKQGADFVDGLRKEFNQKFTELSPDHQYYCILAAKGVVGFVVIGGVCYAIYKTGLVSTCARAMLAIKRQPVRSLLTATAGLIGAAALFATVNPELAKKIASDAIASLSIAGGEVAQTLVDNSDGIVRGAEILAGIYSLLLLAVAIND